jgi:hypothetical protein
MKGHLKKRGKDSWTLVFDLGPDPKTGRRRQRWETIPDRGKREAQRILNSRLAEIEQGTYVEHTDLWLKIFLPSGLTGGPDNILHERPTNVMRKLINKHLSPALGKVELAKLTALEIQTYYSQAEQTGRRRGGRLSARTVLHHHRVLRQALSRAVKWDLLSRNPTDKVEPPKVSRLEMRALDEQQASKLIEFVQSNRILALPVTLAITTGLRRGEILGLKWSDINLDSATMSVRRTLESKLKPGLNFGNPRPLVRDEPWHCQRRRSGRSGSTALNKRGSNSNSAPGTTLRILSVAASTVAQFVLTL